jgi:hypothetical protein
MKVNIRTPEGAKASITWRGVGENPILAGDLGADEGLIADHFHVPMIVAVLSSTTVQDAGKEVSVDPLESKEAFMEAVGRLALLGWLTT